MSAIYIHIPFCKQACHYCDFHFSTSLNAKPDFLNALILEAELQQDFLPSKTIKTLYLGGGTPSLLTPSELEKLLKSLTFYYDLNQLEEFTLEANPDDITPTLLRDFKSLGVNRLSLGIQSVNDKVLKSMNRAHNSDQAHLAVKYIQASGIENFTVDLMYGFPAKDHLVLLNDLKVFSDWRPPHISAYALTIESKTVLGKWTSKGQFEPPKDSFVAEQFELVYNVLEQTGYLAYEVSNFSILGFESKHNSHYWKQLPYLGLGPSAHSFSGSHRYWNISNNAKYIRSILSGQLPNENEELTSIQWVNEVLLTGLRTTTGVALEIVEEKVAKNAYLSFTSKWKALESEGFIHYNSSHISFTRKGRLLGDYLTAKLFFDEESD